MSPQYAPDLTTVTAGFPIYDDGLYEFKIGDAKPFTRKDDKGEEKFGVRYPLVITEVLEDGDANSAGKRAMFTCYLHNDGGQSMAKQFVMAALGYASKREKEFDADHAGGDWAIDPEGGTVGEIWQEVAGSRARAQLGQTLGEDKETVFQSFNWLPVAEAA